MAQFRPLFVSDSFAAGCYQPTWAVPRYELGRGPMRFDQRFAKTLWDPKDLGHDGQVLYDFQGGWPQPGSEPDAVKAALEGHATANEDLQSGRLALALALRRIQDPTASPKHRFWLATGNVINGDMVSAEVKRLPMKVFAAALCAIAAGHERVVLLVPDSKEIEGDVKELLDQTHGTWVLKECYDTEPPDSKILRIVSDSGSQATVHVVPVRTVDQAFRLLYDSPGGTRSLSASSTEPRSGPLGWLAKATALAVLLALTTAWVYRNPDARAFVLGLAPVQGIEPGVGSDDSVAEPGEAPPDPEPQPASDVAAGPEGDSVEEPTPKPGRAEPAEPDTTAGKQPQGRGPDRSLSFQAPDTG